MRPDVHDEAVGGAVDPWSDHPVGERLAAGVGLEHAELARERRHVDRGDGDADADQRARPTTVRPLAAATAPRARPATRATRAALAAAAAGATPAARATPAPLAAAATGAATVASASGGRRGSGLVHAATR